VSAERDKMIEQGLLSFGDPYEKTAREVLAYLDSQAENYWNDPNYESLGLNCAVKRERGA
jgi:hypothetical protein